MPLMNTFTFLTFTRPLASDVSAAPLKHSFAFISHFNAEGGYSILTETSTQSFLVSDNKKCLFLIIIMPDYNYRFFKVKLSDPIRKESYFTDKLYHSIKYGAPFPPKIDLCIRYSTCCILCYLTQCDIQLC